MVFMLSAGAICVAGQVDKAGIVGVVADPNGAVIPGASVEARSTAIGLRREATTDEAGGFVISSLPIGTYELKVSVKGFADQIIAPIVLRVGETARIEVSMSVAGSDAQVEVQAIAPPIDKTTATGGTVIESDLISNLPLNGRHWASLMGLAPGAVNTGSGSQNSIRFNGRGRDENYWTLDGVDQTGVKDPRQEENLRLVVSSEAIAEFRVNTQMFSAEQGTASGAVVNIVSKSGTNRFKGSLFEYVRNEKLNARSFADVLSTKAPPFKLNQFGGSAGGPVIKNKLFFFGSYEGLRQRRTITVTDLVPSDTFRAQVAASPFAAALTPILNVYPRGGTPVNANTNRLERSVKNTLNENSFNFRIDVNWNERQSMFFRGVVDKADASFYNRGDGINQRVFRFLPANFTYQYQQIFSSSLIMETRFGFNRSPLERTDGNQVIADGPRIDGFTRLRPTVDQSEKGTSYSIANNFTWTRGRHTLRFGGEIRFIHVDVSESQVLELRFRSAALFLQNRVDNFTLNTKQELQQTRREYYLPFVQDDFRIRPNITLNLGLRYEYYSVAREKNGRGRVFEFACGGFCPAGYRWYLPDKNNFAPRFGFVWGLFGGKTVFRTGYGVFYSPGQNDDVNNPIDNERDRFSLASSGSLQLSYPVTPFISQGVALFAPRALQPDRRDMYSHNYTASIVQELPFGLTGVLGYNGSIGRNIFSRTYYNTLDPVTLTRQLPAFGEIDTKENRGRSSFNAMQISLYRRAARGLTLGSEYMWSHSINTFAGAGESGYPQDVRNLEGERGDSETDIRHVFTSYLTYGLPFGRNKAWARSGFASAILGDIELSGIVSVSSGRAVNITITRPTNDLPDRNPNAVLRPNLVPGVPIRGNRNGSTGWFNPAAFAMPAPGTWGNAARNIGRGPGLAQFDLSLAKSVRFGERYRLQLRGDLFNVFNRTQYANPGGLLGNVTASGSSRTLNIDPLFGVSTAPLSQDIGTGTPRSLQLAVRFIF